LVTCSIGVTNVRNFDATDKIARQFIVKKSALASRMLQPRWKMFLESPSRSICG